MNPPNTEAALKAAESDYAATDSVFTKARLDLAEADRKLSHLDPGGSAFESLLRDRTTANARVDALKVRLARTDEARRMATVALSQAEAAGLLKTAKATLDQLLEKDAAVTAIFAEARAKLDRIRPEYSALFDAACHAYQALPVTAREAVHVPQYTANLFHIWAYGDALTSGAQKTASIARAAEYVASMRSRS
jgi:hypothetical protein